MTDRHTDRQTRWHSDKSMISYLWIHNPSVHLEPVHQIRSPTIWTTWFVKNFVNVDSTILIEPNCTYISNWIDGLEIKIWWEWYPWNPLYSCLYGALCAYIRSNEFCRCRWHISQGYVYNTGILILCTDPRQTNTRHDEP